MRYNINCKNLLNASEDPCVEVYESCDRDDAGEDKSAPVLVIAENVGPGKVLALPLDVAGRTYWALLMAFFSSLPLSPLGLGCIRVLKILNVLFSRKHMILLPKAFYGPPPFSFVFWAGQHYVFNVHFCMLVSEMK